MGSVFIPPFHSPQFEDPTQAYTRVLSLANMHQEMQQRAQLNPLILQEQQLRLADAQRNQNLQTQQGQILKDSQAEFDAQQKGGAPATPAPGSAPMNAAPYPIKAMGAGSPPANDQGAPPAASMNTSAPYPLSSIATPPPNPRDIDAMDADQSGNAPAPAASAPVASTPGLSSPAPPVTRPAAPTSLNDIVTRRMIAAGLGAHAPALVENLSKAQMLRLQAADAQRQNDDHAAGAKLFQDFHGDPAQMQAHASEYGLSPQGVMEMNGSLLSMQKQRLQNAKDQTDLGLEQHKLDAAHAQTMAGRLSAFMQRPQDDSAEGQAANWEGFIRAAHSDELMSDQHLQDALKQYAKYPGAAEVGHLRDLFNFESGIAGGAAAVAGQAKLAQTQSEQDVRKLLTAPTPEAYTKRVQASGDPSLYPSADQIFDEDGNRTKEGDSLLNSIPMTAQQRAVNAATMARNTNAAQNQQANLTERQRHNAAMETNSVGGRGAALDPAMNKVMTDVNAVMQGQGKTPTPADYVSYLQDPARWANDPEVNPKRAELIAAFQKQAQAAANVAHTNSQTQKNQTGGQLSGIAKLQWMKDHPGQPIPATLPAANQPPAAPPAQKPVTQQPATQQQQPKRLTDPAIAQQYIQKAGGDKAKARALAKADGWSF